MSVTGSTSSQGTHSRSPSRSRSPPYSDGRYPPSSRYSSRYDSYNYRPNRNGMSAALDDYRDLRDRERDRDRDRSMGLMRDDRYLSPRGRDSHDRYTPSYYRDDIPPSHHYSSSSSNIMPRDYPKTNPLRRDVSSDQTKDANKISTSSSSSSVKDLKDDTKPPNTPTTSESYTPSNRYMDWRDRDRDRDRDRRYREDDRRREYDRRGYIRDLRYDSSSYGAPPPPPMNYQIPPFNGDSYRPDRDRDRDMPPSPNIPYYERDRLDDRDFYRPGRNTGAGTTSSNPISDYDRYRARGNRPNWGKLPEDSPRRLDRDRPERIVTDTILIPSERTSPVKEPEKSIEKKDDDVQHLDDSNSPSIEKSSTMNSPEPVLNEGLETGEVIEEKPEPVIEPITSPIIETIQEPEPIKPDSTPASPQMEQGEVIEEEEEEIKSEMTQEQIVNRIDDIENELSIEEELLALAEKREQEALEQETANADDEDETAEDEAAQNKEEAKKQALQAMENDPCADMMDFTDDVSSPMMRKRPQLLINQLRSKNDEEDDRLYEKILSDNRQVAKKNGSTNEEDWSDEEKWTEPLYSKIEDYPCYQENVAKFNQLRIHVSHSLATQKVALEKKEKFLKNEYKALYEQWKEKNLALDRIRDIERKGPDKFGGHRTSSRRIQEQQPEEYTDGVIFTANTVDALRFSNGGASTPYSNNGLYTSDAARSEAELLEIIQSLESAEMRNPENRAKKTTATIPSMILDVRERMRTYDDRSRLVKDPLTYYHTGPDTGDVWNQQEVTTFMESYMMYPKQFERISVAIGTKTACQCVLFYYRKKKKIDFKALMKKGRRGKANKNRDRIAAAIRIATNDSSPTGRKAKSKGSALMTDIGEAQNSRKAKEKDAAERKSKELRDLEHANQYWDSVAERKKTKRPTVTVPPIFTPIVPSGPPSSASDDTDMMLTSEKRRSNSGVNVPRRNKGKSPREVPAEPILALSNEPRYSEDQIMDSVGDEEDDKTIPYAGNTSIGGGVAKWSDREKEMAVEAFKEHGRDFVQVSGLVKSKTEEQCRNFYHNFKRKFGPNAFNEEDARNEILSDVHSEVAAISGRTDLKAEEEDAAAALVGMFQMGANTTMREEDIAPRSRTPSGDIVLPPPPPPPMPVISTPIIPAVAPAIVTPPSVPSSSSSTSQQLQQQRRRRVRSTSSRAESVTGDDTTEWADPDYASRTGGRKLGRTTSLSESKRPAYSSYWSVSERNEFQRLLSIYGRNWERVANEMKSKTVIQVRNFYVNNEEKMQLKEVVDRYLSSKHESMPPMGTSFDTSAAHFQALQNFPFPSPIVDQTPTQPVVTSTPISNYPRAGFFSSPPPHNYPPKNRSLATPSEPVPSAVTKVADLLNNDDPAEPSQNSWDSWFGT